MQEELTCSRSSDGGSSREAGRKFPLTGEINPEIPLFWHDVLENTCLSVGCRAHESALSRPSVLEEFINTSHSPLPTLVVTMT